MNHISSTVDSISPKLNDNAEIVDGSAHAEPAQLSLRTIDSNNPELGDGSDFEPALSRRPTAVSLTSELDDDSEITDESAEFENLQSFLATSFASVSSTPSALNQASSFARQPRSWVWNHFKKQFKNDSINEGSTKPDPKDEWYAVCQEYINPTTQCDFIKRSGKLNGSTGVLLNHLKRCHNYNNDGLKVGTSADNDTYFTKFNPCKESSVLDLYATTVVKNDLSLSLCENEDFRRFLEAYRTSTGPFIISHDALSEVIYSQYQDVVSEIHTKLRNSCTTIALSLAIWSSPNRYGILAIHGTWIGPNFEFNRELLYFNKIEREHSGAYLAHIVYNMLLEFNLCDKLISITADNAGNNTKLCAYLEGLLIMWGRAQNTNIKFSSKNRICCFAHVLNLVCQTMLKVINYNGRDPSSKKRKADQPSQQPQLGNQDSQTSTTEIDAQPSNIPGFSADTGDIQIIRSLVHWINKTPQRKAKWNEKCKKILDYDVPTKWNSTYTMLANAIEVRQELTAYAWETIGLKMLKLDDDFWARLKEVTKVLSIFNDFTKMASEKEASLYLGLEYYDLLDYLLVTASKNPDMSVLREAASEGLSVLKKYRDFVDHTDIYNIASLVNPTVRTKHIQEGEVYGYNRIQNIQRDLESRYPKPPSSQVLESNTNCTDRSLDSAMLKSRMNDINSEPSVSSSRNNYDSSDDIEGYLKSYPSARREGCTSEYIRNWWELRKGEFPRMALVTRDYLCIPLTAVNNERLFSAGENAIRVRRNPMTDETLHALMMLKCHYLK